MTIAATSGALQANNHADVSRIVKKYLSTVTCEEYKSEHLNIFDISGNDGQTDVFGVVWSGDKTCGGGSGAGKTYITPVVLTHWGSLVVVNDMEKSLPYRSYDRVSFENNILTITAKEYLDGDPNCCPSGKIEYSYAYDGYTKEFVAIK